MKQGKLGIILISCLLIASFLLSGTACAQDEDLPNPGITPDSPFYLFDKWGKNIGLFFTFGPEAKARKALQYAEERLAEAQAMAAKNRLREMTRAADEYNGFMAVVNERAEEAIQRGVSDNISERLAATAARIRSRLDALKDKLPQKIRKDVDRVEEDTATSEEAEAAIAQASELSMKVQIKALLALVKAKPERALDIIDASIEGRLNRASDKATENVTEEVTEALEDADKLAEIEDEIAKLAQELGDNTTLAQKLAHITTHRLEVLARVYEKVPETAKPAIERAMENSVSKYERVVVKLQERNELGTIPEEAPLPQKIKEKVRERLELKTATEAQGSDNITPQKMIPAEVREQVREQTSNQKPEKPEPEIYGNKTQEKNTSQEQEQKSSY